MRCRIGVALALGAALAGCGMSEERFARVGLKRWCIQSHNCDAQVDVDRCVDLLRSTDRSGCDFDPVAAQTCHDALVEGVCVDEDLGVRVLIVPEACERTWICGG